MRPSMPYMNYHPEQVPNLENVWCFSVKNVDPKQLTRDLMGALVPGMEIALPHPSDDCSHNLRRTRQGFQKKLTCHGRLSNPWRDATEVEAERWLDPCSERLVRIGAPEGYVYWNPAESDTSNA